MSLTRSMEPAVLARRGGVLYLLVILVGASGIWIRWPLVASGNPARIATHLRSLEGLWRVGTTVDIVGGLLAVGLAWNLYLLFRAVDRDLALLGLLLDGVVVSLQAAFSLTLVAALLPLGSSAYPSGFTREQVEALSYFAVRAHSAGFSISLVFLGAVHAVRGRIILRSSSLPRWLGVLVTIAGAGCLVNGLANLLAPAIARPLLVVVYVPIVAGQIALCLWLLLNGANGDRWGRLANGEVSS